MRTSFLACLFLLCAGARAEVSAIYGSYSPTGSVGVDRPLVSWKVTPTEGGQVTSVDMRLNDSHVPAQFDPRSNKVEFTPGHPLDAGIYSVECRVTIDRELVIRQDWTFEVGSVGCDGSSESQPASKSALAITNDIRKSLGLPDFVEDPRIDAAAEAHSRYQVLNGLTCHVEDPNLPGYTGKEPWDRVRTFGFPGLCYEGACGNQPDPRKAIRLLFDAPYHRIAFLQPGSPEIGLGYHAGWLTVDYAVSCQEGAGLAPAPDQARVPCSWDGNESPSPLTIHHASGSTGYPIVFGWYSPRLESIRITSMSLRDELGFPVDAYVNTPLNDPELRFAGILIPKAPLQAFTTYTVTVSASTFEGKKIGRTWSFTTGPSAA